MQIFLNTISSSITSRSFLQCLLLLVERNAKPMCSRRMRGLLDNRVLVAKAKGRSQVKCRKSHTLLGQYNIWIIANAIISGRNFPSLQPFEIVADFTALDPQDIFDCIRGLSKARYERDLYRVFNESAPTQDKGLLAMHKTWFEVSDSTDGLYCYTQNVRRLLGYELNDFRTSITCFYPPQTLRFLDHRLTCIV